MKKKEIKDAYPKKVCHMPTRHVKKDAYPKKVCHIPTRHAKKKKKKKIARIQEKKGGERGIVQMSSSTIHQTKIIHTLAHLDQGL